MSTSLITELAKVKAMFQQRTILAALGVNLSNPTPLEPVTEALSTLNDILREGV